MNLRLEDKEAELRAGGAQMLLPWEDTFSLDQWESWPRCAVSGVTALPGLAFPVFEHSLKQAEDPGWRWSVVTRGGASLPGMCGGCTARQGTVLMQMYMQGRSCGTVQLLGDSREEPLPEE